LPKWKKIFVEQPPRPSPKDCINAVWHMAVVDMVAQQVLERRAIRKSQKQMGE
jgi:hypothetical protein